MLIVAVTLFVLHAIVRHLVLYPMYHLRDVSDAITHGDTNQRATIETEDEFRELADAFNRMLRHLTETQDQIQEVNNELDARVDQLAQLNLQLYEANRLKSDFLANMSHELANAAEQHHRVLRSAAGNRLARRQAAALRIEHSERAVGCCWK